MQSQSQSQSQFPFTGKGKGKGKGKQSACYAAVPPRPALIFLTELSIFLVTSLKTTFLLENSEDFIVITIQPTIANNKIIATIISQGEKVVYIILPILVICELEIKFPSHLLDVEKSICALCNSDPMLSLGIKLYITIENMRAKGMLLPV